MYRNIIIEDVRQSLHSTTLCPRCKSQVLDILEAIDADPESAPVGLNGLRKLTARNSRHTTPPLIGNSEQSPPRKTVSFRSDIGDQHREDPTKEEDSNTMPSAEEMEAFESGEGDVVLSNSFFRDTSLMRVVHSFNNVPLRYHRASVDFWAERKSVTADVEQATVEMATDESHVEVENGGKSPKSRKSVAFGLAPSNDDTGIQESHSSAAFAADARRRRSTKRQSLSLDMLIRLNTRRKVSLEDSLAAKSVNDRTEVEFRDEVSRSKDEFGCKLINDYVIVDDLGRGAFGKVKLCMHQVSNEPYAIKVLKKSFLRRAAKPGGLPAMQAAQHEIAIMKKINHANIVRLVEVIDDPKFDKMYLVMQYVEGGKLADISPDGTCNRIDDPQSLLSILRQLSSALS
jgi:hypothetical protein